MRSLLGFLALTAAAAAVGALVEPGSWYASIDKPDLTPPDAVFGPVWGALYLMIAVAGWLLWQIRDTSPAARVALGLWLFQLLLNALWSGLFFGVHRLGLAFAEILVLWLAILATIAVSWRARPSAGMLLIPYFLWVGFAAWLNGTIWLLNR